MGLAHAPFQTKTSQDVLVTIARLDPKCRGMNALSLNHSKHSGPELIISVPVLFFSRTVNKIIEQERKGK